MKSRIEKSIYAKMKKNLVAPELEIELNDEFDSAENQDSKDSNSNSSISLISRQ